YDRRLYVTEYFGGILACYDARTGEPVFRERLPGVRQCIASLLACRGRVYALGDDGTMAVVAAGPRFKLIGRNKLSDSFWAKPAITSDAILLRSASAVFCVRKPAVSGAVPR